MGLILLFIAIAMYVYCQKSRVSKNNSNSLKICFSLIVVAVLLFLLTSSIQGFSGSNRRTLPNNPALPSSQIPQQQPTEYTMNPYKDSVHMAWVYQQPLPTEFLTNIKANSKLLNEFPIVVYCGSTQCVNDVEIIDSAITVQFLNLVELMKDTPLEDWLSQHVIHKVLTGKNYEYYLNEAVKFSILWKYGGVYIDPSISLESTLPQFDGTSSWIAPANEISIDTLLVCKFSTGHPMLEELMKTFVDKYPGLEQCSTIDWPIIYDVQSVVNSTVVTSSVHNVNMKYKLVEIDRLHNAGHFSTLSFQSRQKYVSTCNLGDEMQGFGGLQFVPFIDRFIDRERIVETSGKEPVTIFFNAWWGTKQSSWPPPPNVHPVLVSVHADEPMFISVWGKDIDYFKSREPIGCRDSGTLNLMRQYGVEAYFSACMTLTIRNPNLNKPRTNDIYFVDAKHTELLPPDIVSKGIKIKQGGLGYKNVKKFNVFRFAKSYENALKYSTAKVVVTSRIHAALPCVGMGTPVVFINSAKLPGGGGSINKESDRVGGLLQFFHTINLYDMSDTEAKETLKNFNWNNPPPNPNIASFMARKATFWNVLRENPVFYDTARRYNLLPISPPLFKGSSEDLVFHVSFNDNVNRLSLRSVESVFYHHPSAKVIVHSETAKQEDFIVFTESGFTVEVRSEEPIIDLWTEKSKRLLNEMYNDGGVAMSSNVILLRPLSIQESIILSPSLSSQVESSSFEKFPASDETLKRIIEDGKKDFADDKNIIVLQDNDIHYIQQEQCSSKKSESLGSRSIAVLNLNGAGMEKVTFDNLCKHILNSFCVLCNVIL